jgi:hypothetical protein
MMYKGAAVIRFTIPALLFSISALTAGCQEDDNDLSGELESDLAPGQHEASSEALATGDQELATANLCFDSPKVAVVGAGATGLTTAYLLGRQGYDRVTVFEKDAEVGGFARTRFVNGKPYDLATMFVPGSTIAGHGIEPLLAEMIQVSGEPLVPAVDFGSLIVTPQGNAYNERSLPILAACSTPAAVPACKQQLLDGLALQTKFMQCLSQGVDPIACGIADPANLDETVVEWGARNNVSLFVQLMLYTADGLGASGDLGRGVPGIALLVPLSYWMPAEVHRALKQLGVPASEIPATLPNLRSIYAANSQRWYFFQNGYQTFFQKLVEAADIDVRLNSTVRSVRHVWWRPWRPWDVTVANRQGRLETHQFDKVIITTPPGPAASMLPPGAPQASLLRTAVAGGYPTNIYLAPVSGRPPVVGGNLPNPFAFWVKDPSIEPSPPTIPPVRPFFWQRRHAGLDHMIIGAYHYQDISLAAAYSALQDYASRKLGISVRPYQHVLQVKFPSVPSDPTAWQIGWALLQGQQELYFTGEAFLGSGVPAITAGLSRFTADNFPEEDGCWP